jgi:large subunit ribosomal protein L9
MRVLLLKDVYKLGRAGDVKRVADGYGRNYLLPQGLAVLATPGALKQADRIRASATELRIRLNQEMGSVAERLTGLSLAFPAKAGETGKLYGSITTAMLADAIERETGIKVDRRQIDSQPLKALGVHKARVRLTVDLIPEITVIVHREGEPPESAYQIEVAEPVEAFSELRAELEAEAEAEPEDEGEAELESEAESAPGGTES